MPRCRRPPPAVLAGLALLATAGPAPAGQGDPREEARRAFQDARFGLSVDWGVYSLLGKGPWVMERDRLPVSEYEKLLPLFNPSGFDAEAWVKAAKGAGARYLVVAAKHHDGFCMFESGLTGYDVVDATPYARDPLKALADACRRHGVSLVLYYSLLDWHHPDYAPGGATGKSSGRDGNGDWRRYLAYCRGQIRELCTNYGPIAGVWLDGAWDRPDADWDLGVVYELVRRLQPRALVANSHRGARAGEDVRTFDRGLPGGGAADRAEADPAPAREVYHDLSAPGGPRVESGGNDLVRLLAGLSGRGANLRLGVAADPDGVIPAEAADRLAGVGRWLARHGESVYGTRPGPVPPQPWGVSTRDAGDGPPSVVYLHVLQPGPAIALPGATPPFDARPLGSTRLLEQRREGGRVVISLPGPDAVIELRPRPSDHDPATDREGRR